MSNLEGKKLKFVTEEEYAEYRTAFKIFDKKKTGYLSVEQLCLYLNEFHKEDHVITIDDCKALMLLIDKDNNGLFDFDEFVLYLQNLETDKKEDRKKLFERFDFQNKGYVTPYQLKTSLKIFGIEVTFKEALKIIERFDTDKTGYLSFEQFGKLMYNDCVQ